MMAVGVGYRVELAAWIDTEPSCIDCLEITAEHFYDRSPDRLRELRRRYRLFVHGLGLSLGTPGPLDETALARFEAVVDAADPDWISEHVAFTRTPEVDLGHLNPVPTTPASLAVLAEHALELAQRCHRPLILENITTHLRLAGGLAETDFLNRLCDQAGCGLLLDVTNLYINGSNFGFDPVHWLREIEPGYIRQLHVVGYSRSDGQLVDLHAEAIQEELFELTAAVLEYSPVRAVIIERDAAFGQPSHLEAELTRLRGLADAH